MMVWAPCKQGPCCHIQPTLRPGSLSAQAHPFWEINTNLNKVMITELDLSNNVLIPENVVVAFFFQPVRLKSMEKKSPEVKSWGELFFMNPFALISLETQASTNIEHSETLQGRSQPWFQPLLFSQPPVFRKSVMVMTANAVCDNPTIEWTHCGGGILFGISDDLSKTQLKCCPPLKYFVNPTFSLEQPSSSFSLPSPLLL